VSFLSAAQAVSVARWIHEKATSGQRADASPPRRIRSPVVARLESQRAAPRLHAARVPPTGGNPDRPSQPEQARPTACDPFPGAAGALSPLVARAAGTQCLCPNVLPAHHHPIRGARCLRRLPRPVYSAVASCCPDERLLSSERRSSPSGCSCLLRLAVPQLLSSAARFAPSAAVSLNSLSKTFGSGRRSPTPSEINSSRTSLRNSWA
jgi:hypothetical protein